jgi:hypothetical protein
METDIAKNGMNINNTSLDGYVKGDAVGVGITDRTCLIMDEVDGMSSGDRGGVGALNALIKKSKVQSHPLRIFMTQLKLLLGPYYLYCE